PTITLLKAVDNTGTDADAVDTDWTLTAAGPGDPPVVQTGTEGEAAITAASVPPGSYVLSESGGPSYYTASDWTCWDNATPGDTSTAAMATIDLALGDAVTCEITNTAVAGEYTYSKAVDLDGDAATDDDGATVEPGDTITYTLTLTHSTGAPVDDVVLSDNLAAVLDNATLVEPLAAGLTLDGTNLVWTVATLAPGDELTANYQVTVNPDAWGTTIGNVVTSEEGECEVDCDTSNPTPAYDLAKTADPADGSAVQPGDQVDYTLTVTNVSDAEVSGVQITDDLSDVLDNAILEIVNGLVVDHADPATFPAGTAFDPATSVLTWSVPTLLAGADPAELTYSVRVNPDQWGASLRNVATPPPDTGGECETDCDTEHPIPAWTLTKTADPADGTSVEPGDEVTYTLALTNIGETSVTGAKVTDDLSDVLDNATLVEPLADGLEVSGNTLTWSVPAVEVGDTVSVNYTVTVDAAQWGEKLHNVATPTGGGACATDCETEHSTPNWTLVKAADPVDGRLLDPGDRVTYTLTASNTGDGTATDIEVTDDLSGLDGLANLDVASIA
ncbi:MAG: isopeptide-forming domain-containing fimbrial protein, partial [Paracoccus sp. (in: a-proteobacteria)]